MTTTLAFKEYLTPKERSEFDNCYYRGLPAGNPNVAIPSADGWRVCVDDIVPATQLVAPVSVSVHVPNGFTMRVCLPSTSSTQSSDSGADTVHKKTPVSSHIAIVYAGGV